MSEVAAEEDPFAVRVAERLARRLAGEPPQPPAFPSWAKQLLVEARKRAKKRGIKFTLTHGDMESMMDRAGGACEISGVPFDFSRGIVARRPFVPSIDRIDCARGYTSGNCRLVVYAANAAMNVWGIETLLTVARGVVRKHGP